MGRSGGGGRSCLTGLRPDVRHGKNGAGFPGEIDFSLDFLQCNNRIKGMYDDRNCARAHKRMGRPSLGPLAKRGNFTLRVHEDELALWRKMAKKEGITLTAFIIGPLRESLARRKAKKA